MNLKLNVLLAKTDYLASPFKKGLEDYIKFFKSSQGAFKGEKKTYQPAEGTIDIPSERSNKLVVTTVSEKLDWLEKSSKEYLDALFSQEKTNASGKVMAELVVEGKSWGKFTSLELLKLKSLLELPDLKGMYENLPVRNDDEEWNPTSSDQYKGRDIFESPLSKGEKKTTTKENYILSDPNISKVEGAKYTPQIASKDTISKLGDYTFQKFTGETSHRERAEILRRRSILLGSVIEALKIANEAEIVQSELTADKIFNYLHRGQ